MKLTKRILVAAVMLAIFVSAFVFTSSAEFTADNIEDILEYYPEDYPKYVKENFNSQKTGIYDYCAPLDSVSGPSLVSTQLMTDFCAVVTDPENAKNGYLTHTYLAVNDAANTEAKYFGYHFTLTENITEMVFTTKIYVDRNGARELPSYSLVMSSYDEYGVPVGEASLVTALTVDFEAKEIYYAIPNVNDPTKFDMTLVSGAELAVEEDAWYTVSIIVDSKAGAYKFSIQSDNDELYESPDISLGALNSISGIYSAFKTFPVSSGVVCSFDDIEFYRGTFFRGDEDLYEMTVNALYNISELIKNEELDFATRLRIISVYDKLFAGGFEPSSTNKFQKHEVVALYEEALAYIPATYTEIFCAEVEGIDSAKSYSRREIKIAELSEYITYELINDEAFYIASIDDALSKIGSDFASKIDEAIAELDKELLESGLTEEKIAELTAKREKMLADKESALKAIRDYKELLMKSEKPDERLEQLTETLWNISYDYNVSSDALYDNINVITVGEDFLNKLRTAFDAYNAEIAALKKVEEDSKAFIAYMQTYDPANRNYAYIMGAYADVLKIEKRDNSYKYSYENPSDPESVYCYIPEYERLVKKVMEINASVKQFTDGVLKMQDANFNVKFNEGYLSAKEVYNDGKIHEAVDVTTVEGLPAAIAKYLEIEATFSVTIGACENFIMKVEEARFHTLYETKKAAVTIARNLWNSDANINQYYPGVKEANDALILMEAEILTLEKDYSDYIAAVNAINAEMSFYTKQAAIDKALSLQEKGNKIGLNDALKAANDALASFRAEIKVLEGNSKTFVETVAKLNNSSLTLKERRELIITAERVKAGVEPSYNGVKEALGAIENYKSQYKANAEAINNAFFNEVVTAASVTGASANQSRYYPVIEVIKLLVASFN